MKTPLFRLDSSKWLSQEVFLAIPINKKEASIMLAEKTRLFCNKNSGNTRLSYIKIYKTPAGPLFPWSAL
jgi:hypothetical protein